MQPDEGQIAIAGAGIAGLTAALAFSRLGFSTRLFERAPHLQEAGAGLQLSPNATRILDRLGVLDRLLPKAVRPLEIAIRRADTLRLLATVPLGEHAERRWGAPYLTIHRADLQEALLAAISDRQGILLETGAAVESIAFTAGTATLSTARNGVISQEAFALVAGADGVWSTLRRRIAGARASRYTGYMAWRAIADDDAGILPRDRVTTFVHRNFHLVAYPIRGGETINLVAVTRAPSAAESWSNEADPSLLTKTMGGVAPGLAKTVATAGPWTTWPIHEVPPTGSWTQGTRLALIGDAAHAMSPYAAQGAAMAIEDADILADAVSHEDDMATALSRYERLRRPRVDRVVARGGFNRFAWHAAGPVAFARDLVLAQRRPQALAADLDWLYGYDTQA